MKKEYNLAPLWRATLDVYEAFALICQKHKLRYYFTDGSAIGAVRHGGFIPWDDDIDISMPREDYDEFMRVAPKELPSHLCCLSIGITPGYPLLHGKVQETRRDYVKTIEQQVGYTLSSGIFIDLFPFDGWSGSKIIRAINQCKYRLLWRARECQSISWKQINRKKAFVMWIVGVASRLLYGNLLNKVNFALASQSVFGVRTVGDSPWTARVRFWLDRRLILSSDVWGVPVMKDFCGIKVPLPARYNDYLRQDYGDYMQLPPVEQRVTTHSLNGIRDPWWLGYRDNLN